LKKIILILAVIPLLAGNVFGADFVDEVGRKISLE
jgi:hypothetical protein